MHNIQTACLRPGTRLARYFCGGATFDLLHDQASATQTISRIYTDKSRCVHQTATFIFSLKKSMKLRTLALKNALFT